MWILTVMNVAVWAGYCVSIVWDKIESYKLLVQTYEAETRIQEAQLSDVLSSLKNRESLSYQDGYEAGKVQTGVAFLHSGTMQSYSDGYHAAISQWGEVNPESQLPAIPSIENTSDSLSQEDTELLNTLKVDAEKVEKLQTRAHLKLKKNE